MPASAPGKIFIEPVRRVGRQKHCGTLAFLSGHQVVCIGYSVDGTQAVYATPEQLKFLRHRWGHNASKLSQRLLQALIERAQRNLA